MTEKHGSDNEESGPAASSFMEKKQLVEIEDARDGEHLLTRLQSSMMVFKFTVGAGWFSLPAAFKHSGILVGVICVIIVGILTAFGMRKLVEAAWEVSKRTGSTIVTFGDLGEECVNIFSTNKRFLGRYVVDFFMVFVIFSLLCPMIVFVADIWKQGFQEFGLTLDISNWVLIAFVLLFPLFLIKRPDILAVIAMFTNIVMVFASVSLLVYGFLNITEWKADITVTWLKLPLTFGIISFAFEIAPFVLIVENVMREPKQLPLVINSIMTAVIVLYSLMGAIGYAACHEKCKDSIILNLPSMWYFSMIKVLIGLTACVSSALFSYITFDILESTILKQVPEERHTLVSFLLRLLNLTISCGVAAAVPQLANLMSLVGAIAVSIIGFIFPAVANTILLYTKMSKFSLAKNLGLLICGILLLMSGTYTSLKEIIKDY